MEMGGFITVEKNKSSKRFSFWDTSLDEMVLVLMAGLEPARPFEAGDFLTTLCCHSRAVRVVVWTMS